MCLTATSRSYTKHRAAVLAGTVQMCFLLSGRISNTTPCMSKRAQVLEFMARASMPSTKSRSSKTCRGMITTSSSSQTKAALTHHSKASLRSQRTKAVEQRIQKSSTSSAWRDQLLIVHYRLRAMDAKIRTLEFLKTKQERLASVRASTPVTTTWV